jgi:hypothetical protein
MRIRPPALVEDIEEEKVHEATKTGGGKPKRLMVLDEDDEQEYT